MKARIYTEAISQEEWSLDEEAVEKLIKYLKSDKSWDPFDKESNEDIIWELENNPDKYADELRSWLYGNMYEPHKEWCGEEGNTCEFYKKD